jgi:hypothetical protein
VSLTFFRDARWLTQRRIRDYAIILIAAYVAVIAWLLSGQGVSDPSGNPVGTDFVSFWTVSSALLNHDADAIYNPAALAGLEQTIAQRHQFYAWLYPPIALLVVYPLALLPYLWSLAAWLGAGIVGYLSVLWRILPQPLTSWAGLAFPAVLVTIEHGQNALLTTTLLAWALIVLPRRPVIAGILIGLLTFKPQVGLLIPIALLAGGYWRAMIVAATTVLGLAAVTVLFFGFDIWSEYVAVAPLGHAVLQFGLVPHYKMQSVYAAGRLLGATSSLALGVQVLATLGAAIFLVWIWRPARNQNIKNVALIAATLFATPFLLDYDLLLLAPAVAWMISAMLQSRALPWERVTLAALCLDPLVARAIGQTVHVPLTPFVLLALMLVVARRARSELRAPKSPLDACLSGDEQSIAQIAR